MGVAGIEPVDLGSEAEALRLVYVTTALPFGPEETFIIPEITELEKRGYRVIVVPVRPRRTVFHDDARALTAIAMPILSVPVVGSALLELGRRPTLLLYAAGLLASSRNACVFLKNLTVLPKALWLGRLARQQQVDHIHAHFASTSATVALVASKVSGAPWSFTAHRWDISANNLLGRKLATARFVRAIDRRGQQELMTYSTVSSHKLRVIHVGVAAPDSIEEKLPPVHRPLRVLLAARFDEMKGHRYALDAVARLRAGGLDVSLDCPGFGPLKRTVERYAAALGLSDRVRFPGLLDHHELLRGLAEHRWDVALLPSLETREEREGIPVFLMEAMAAGVPVVATNTGGIPELVEQGSGIVVPQRDANAIADALALIAADCDLRQRLGQAGTQRVREQFAVEASVSALLDEISPSSGEREAASTCVR
jgi:colanic acid/amylovoran biosynthesis glycosyltransferase